jgi:hypothetical protein
LFLNLNSEIFLYDKRLLWDFLRCALGSSSNWQQEKFFVHPFAFSSFSGSYPTYFFIGSLRNNWFIRIIILIRKTFAVVKKAIVYLMYLRFIRIENTNKKCFCSDQNLRCDRFNKFLSFDCYGQSKVMTALIVLKFSFTEKTTKFWQKNPR